MKLLKLFVMGTVASCLLVSSAGADPKRVFEVELYAIEVDGRKPIKFDEPVVHPSGAVCIASQHGVNVILQCGLPEKNAPSFMTRAQCDGIDNEAELVVRLGEDLILIGVKCYPKNRKPVTL